MTEIHQKQLFQKKNKTCFAQLLHFFFSLTYSVLVSLTCYLKSRSTLEFKQYTLRKRGRLRTNVIYLESSAKRLRFLLTLYFQQAVDLYQRLFQLKWKSHFAERQIEEQALEVRKSLLYICAWFLAALSCGAYFLFLNCSLLVKF